MSTDEEETKERPVAPSPLRTKGVSSMVETGYAKYEVGGEIGRGAAGRVVRARDKALGRDVALKVMRHDGDQPDPERFLREGQIVAALTHPNLVTVYEVGITPEGAPFIAMELLDGVDLLETIRKERPSIQRSLEIVSEVLSGLVAVHSARVVHRDIKPANVFVCRDGRIKITDFGVARKLEGSAWTNQGTVLGTPNYLSPEQAAGQEVDARSDQFSVGVMLYELACGVRPFDADPPFAILKRIVEAEPDWAPITRIGLGLEAVLKRALAKAREDRFPDAMAFRAAVTRLSSDGLATRDVAVQKEAASLRVERDTLAPTLDLRVPSATTTNQRNSRLAAASARLATERAEALAVEAAAKALDQERHQLTIRKVTELRDQIDELFREIQETAPLAVVNAEFREVSLGKGVLYWMELFRLNPQEFAESQRRVIFGGRFGVKQDDATYPGRSANLWLADWEGDGVYGWWEVAYESTRGQPAFRPFGIEVKQQLRDVGRANAGFRDPYVFAEAPVRIDGPGKREFFDRWIDRLAAAADGKLLPPATRW